MKIKITPKMISRLHDDDKCVLKKYIKYDPHSFWGVVETKELDEAMNAILRIKDAIVFKEMYASGTKL